jgi:hypothetical protein
LESVRIKAAFERFPATVKGAFLLRGADGLPHQVRIEGAWASERAGRGKHPIQIEPMVLEVAPTMDTFVPFELPLIDLPSGWYQIGCDVVVDGVPSVEATGEPFTVPWPRSAVRRGSAAIGKKSGSVKLESLECASDSVKVTFASEKAPSVKLLVDGEAHPVLEIEHDPETGRGTVVGYPVLRGQSRLVVEIKGEAAVEVRLP